MPRLSRLLGCLLLAGSCWGSAIAAQVSKSVVLLMSEELDGKGQVIPIRTEIMEVLHALEQRAGLKFEIRRYPWKRALENAANGEGLIFGISKTRERLHNFTFSTPIFADQSLLVTLCNAKFQFNSLNDLKGKTIGIVRGTSYGEEFDRLSNVLFKVEDDTGNIPGRFQKLVMGRMDAFLYYSSATNIRQLENRLNQQYAAEFTGKQTNAALFCILPKPVSSVDIHIAIRPDLDRGLMEKLDRAIVRSREDGVLARIYNPR
ncbi:transporter substrate-binding domain-containing protein [Undibacterium sp. TS12]|uniref:substrate-binding periplasmic protein n=1 Tax=Undibacterium sp. TS12 TaxID=2908202 RepID=UPI001F4C9FC3|nr:transporter substrate-binding domain-containing protein [Undibacterium sp. TS12]MCH8618317.1 transporter substrate-binding domain-containing protein [Undibacterium sp. TS12]